MTKIEEYYNKFNEDKRLLSRHGQVEFNTTMHFIDKTVSSHFGNCTDSVNDNSKNQSLSVIDIGAGTGRYSIALARKGMKVTAVELVNHNLGMIKKNAKEMLPEGIAVEAYKADARKLKRFKDNSFDMALLLGPMYHLHTMEDKVCALKEAKRVVRPGGVIFAGYVMADYAIVKYGFMEHHILESVHRGAVDENYAIPSSEDELYDYVRLEDIDRINREAGLVRSMIISPDGAADYIRNFLNEMTEEEFKIFCDYQIKCAERPELVGAGSHTVDILIKE